MCMGFRLDRVKSLVSSILEQGIFFVNSKLDNEYGSKNFYRSREVQDSYLIGLTFCLLVAILVFFMYANDLEGKSNVYFFVIMFVAFSLTATFSSFVSRDIYYRISPPIYWVFVFFFNLVVIFLVLLISWAAIFPSGWGSIFIEKYELMGNLSLIIYISIAFEFGLDTFACLLYATKGGEFNQGWKWAYIFVSLELVLVMLSVIPGLEVCIYDTVIFAGILSIAHILQAFLE